MRNTLDLDFNDTDRLVSISNKVCMCPYCDSFEWKDSPSMNGKHIIMWCNKNCDLCRFVFDDPARYAADLTRPEYTRDVLWERKSFFKANHTLIMKK